MRGALARAALVLAALALGACRDAPTGPITPPPASRPVDTAVPAIPREFRGLWIATVANIDWPSRSTLTREAQQAELLAMLDRARAVGVNAIILQVRAAGDALYPSALEPWSRSLTGTQGVDPGWDPVAFALQQAHARGLELHAWFNPFRAGNLSDSLTRSAGHLARRRPDLVRPFCTQLWFDPGEHEVQAHALAVIADVVRRYDVDAVHLDDYFYPYPDSRCLGLSFPDSASYARYVRGGGQLTRDDWRRDNVNRFVEALRPTVHAMAPHVRVGISPFGIWRPGTPAGITGLDAYASIYADSQWWLSRGWVDYFAPQLYWARNSVGQPFNTLLDWWISRNTMQRHLWPGLAAYRVADGTSSAFSAAEIEGQIASSRARAGATGGPTGAILYNTTVVMQDRGGLATLLQSTVNAAPAVVPATPWLGAVAPSAPIARGAAVGTGRELRLDPSAGTAPRWWLVRWRDGGAWRLRQLPAAQRTLAWPSLTGGGLVPELIVEALSPTGVASPFVRVSRDAP
jgi:uncharacterized lipoprotein YddW (UPF0748 family)